MNKGIVIRNIIKDFPAGDKSLRILSGINLDIEPGKLTMLVGPSGSGKTSLLSIIAGILTPTEGDVIINGINIRQLTDENKVLFRRLHLGFIFQQFNLIPTLTIVENVSLPLVARGTLIGIALKKAQEFLAMFGIAENADKYPRQLSGGQQQRVAIARALVGGPDVIICDEPTASLDAQSGETVMKILRENALKPDRVVLVVTHDSRIFPYADRIIHLSDGKIVKDEIPQGLRE